MEGKEGRVKEREGVRWRERVCRRGEGGVVVSYVCHGREGLKE